MRVTVKYSTLAKRLNLLSLIQLDTKIQAFGFQHARRFFIDYLYFLD